MPAHYGDDETVLINLTISLILAADVHQQYKILIMEKINHGQSATSPLFCLTNSSKRALRCNMLKININVYKATL